MIVSIVFIGILVGIVLYVRDSNITTSRATGSRPSIPTPTPIPTVTYMSTATPIIQELHVEVDVFPKYRDIVYNALTESAIECKESTTQDDVVMYAVFLGYFKTEDIVTQWSKTYLKQHEYIITSVHNSTLVEGYDILYTIRLGMYILEEEANEKATIFKQEFTQWDNTPIRVESIISNQDMIYIKCVLPNTIDQESYLQEYKSMIRKLSLYYTHN